MVKKTFSEISFLKKFAVSLPWFKENRLTKTFTTPPNMALCDKHSVII